MNISVGNTKRHILLTGPPGIGKTTLIQKICNALRDKDISMKGFYTEEIRINRKRIGFDIVTLDGKREPLARTSQDTDSRYKVGQYTVQVKSFETCALPVFSSDLKNPRCVLVLDEIGRMELLSDAFKDKVIKAFSDPSITVLATIPIRKAKPISLVENLREHPNSCVLAVDMSNRDILADRVVHMITKT